ncbi:unnamed protein product [Mytilus edulis]|uniref:DZIP3-like HEPN domain-containing protein n=1 Tax=Mytilus edulis TaxID=6550 RepID=A0A8S3TJT1_MYTED|nr:unnamed protein product [Mytilus edulis]
MATNTTKEEDNFLRIVYLYYRVGITVLRRFFDGFHRNLQSDLSFPPNKAILLSLHKPPRGQRKVLYQEQWDILYPSSGSAVISSVDLDTTLMVCLLRHLPPNISPPAFGFDALPQSHELSDGAHIARIKYYKNFIVSHSKDGQNLAGLKSTNKRPTTKPVNTAQTLLTAKVDKNKPPPSERTHSDVSNESNNSLDLSGIMNFQKDIDEIKIKLEGVTRREDLDRAIHSLGNQQDVIDAADAKSKCLDHNTLKKLVNFDDRLNDHSNELAVQSSKITKLAATIQKGHSDLKEKIKKIKIEQEECIPKNIREQTEKEITEWEKKDKMFVTTRARTPGSGTYPLVLTCYDGYTDMLQWMLRNDVDIDQSRDDAASQNGYADIVRLLLEKNPNVDLCGNNGCSPLNMASQYGHTDVVKLLLEKNPNVNLCGKNDCSPLYMASQNGYTDIVRLLLEKNPNVDLCGYNGCSPLNMASQYGHTDVVKLLLEKNPNVNLCGKNDCSPLYKASQNGYTDIVRLLLEKNPNVDLCGNNGCSPLNMAFQSGHTDIVELLLKKNLNIDL